MSAQRTRREMIKGTAIAAAAAMMVPRAVRAAGSDLIKIGMIGCGGRCSGAAIDAMSADPGTRLVAMCDLFDDRVQGKLKSLKSQKPDQVQVDPEHCFVGLDAYKKVIDSCDAVLVANAAKFHPFHLRAAIEAGRHCFLEKPHAIDPVGVREIIAATELAKQKKLSVLSGLQSRFDPGIVECIKRVMDGEIGEVVSIEENFIRAPYGTLFRAPGLSEIQYQYSNQYRFGWLCGDDVTQSLIHNLDRATWALGETPPTKCHGLAGRSSCFDVPYIYGDVFDHHSVVYHYKSGVRVYALCRTQPNCYNEDSSIILCAKGIAYPKSRRITTRAGEVIWKYSGNAESPYKLEHVAFFNAIRSGQPLNCGDYMARSTLVAVMGQMSCYSGKEITWDQATKSDFQFKPAPQDCRWDMTPPVVPDDKGIYPVPIPGKTKVV